MALHIIDINEIEGFRLGNAEDKVKGTGCTVIVCPEGAVGGVDVRGGAPATRETDLLRSENSVDRISAVMLSGGSAFGLEAASGAMRELSERGIGYSFFGSTVPVVCGASLFDLPVGDTKAFPDVEMGRDAVRNAFRGGFKHGNNGAGTGATVGKLKGMKRSMKSGLGTYACDDGRIQVGACVAVNALGDVYSGAGRIIAGLRTESGNEICGTVKCLKSQMYGDDYYGYDESESRHAPHDINSAASRRDIAASLRASAASTGVDEDTSASEDMYLSMLDTEETEPSEGARRGEVRKTYKEEAPAKEKKAIRKPFETVSLDWSEEQPAAGAGESGAPSKAARVDHKEVLADIRADKNTIVLSQSDLIRMKLEDAFSKLEIPPEYRKREEKEAAPVVKAAPQPAETPVSAETEYAYEGAHSMKGSGQTETVDTGSADQQVPEDLGYDIPFNTTIGCLITNAKLTKAQANKLASVLHDAYARAIKPVHSTVDGDTIFVLTTNRQEVDFDAFAALATDVMQYAIIDGASSAKGAYGLPAAGEI